MFPGSYTDPASASDSTVRRVARIMVVDDEPDTVITLLELLRGEGYEAEGFGSGKAALERMAAFDPDVVISDIAMPVVSGWDVAKAVRASMGDRRPVLIAISGQYTKGADKALAQVKGFNYYLAKPCDPKRLLSLLGPLAANLP
ncbi:MAG TPA: response regulator [Burkholderiales bacterium]|nr:response regulator [Burkholderiales bacterium]